MATLTFCGAAGTVTGSCSLVETGRTRFLVDCGMFQGNRSIRDLNYQPFPFDPKAVDFLVVTHAHIDHSGLVPKLVKHGFQGPIYCTEATADLLEFMLPDSAHIQLSDVARANRKRQRRGQKPLEPVYAPEHADKALGMMQPIKDYEQWFEPAKNIRVRCWNAGHLLGSASVEVVLEEAGETNKLRLLFSGDLGPDQKAFHPEPDAPEGFDYLLCESTYGAREREDYTLEQRRTALREKLHTGLSRGGNVVIPSFAVERSQELLHDIGTLLSQGEIPPATVYLDSPLASRVTRVFVKHSASLQDVAVDEAELFRHPNFHIVEKVEDSIAINSVTRGAIIISASGMCDAGRIKHHLKNNIWRDDATVLFVGYQAPGTLGQVITSGKPRVRIHGQEFEVNADIQRIGNYSAHADQGELADWVMERAPVVGGLFLNHGEDEGREGLRDVLVGRGFDRDKIFLPQFDERFELVAGSAESKGRAADRIADAALRRDWHNDYAEFILELSAKLQSTPDAESRQALIRRVAAAMQAD